MIRFSEYNKNLKKKIVSSDDDYSFFWLDYLFDSDSPDD